MPYVKPEARMRIGPLEDVISSDLMLRINHIEDVGELNYAITQLMIHYVRKHGLRYAQINDVMGAVEGAKQEFYRRVVAPYEDIKIRSNGDVYED